MTYKIVETAPGHIEIRCERGELMDQVEDAGLYCSRKDCQCRVENQAFETGGHSKVLKKYQAEIATLAGVVDSIKSSMTEEEKEEFAEFLFGLIFDPKA